MTKKEDKIIRKCKKGDPEAQTTMYTMYSNKWFLLSMRYASNRDEANDILQEGLVQIFKDIGSYDKNKSAFITWSSRVLVHAAIKYLNKNRTQNTYDDIELAANVSVGTIDVHSRLSEKSW